MPCLICCKFDLGVEVSPKTLLSVGERPSLKSSNYPCLSVLCSEHFNVLIHLQRLFEFSLISSDSFLRHAAYMHKYSFVMLPISKNSRVLRCLFFLCHRHGLMQTCHVRC